jgi:simple sugar transport system substrate-binding protein
MWGVKVHYQYSKWAPDVMISQFKEAMAANPDGIVIMGHPGNDSFAPFVDEAVSMGIIVTSGNTPLPELEAKYVGNGFGYVGSSLFDWGYSTANALVRETNLGKGDKIFIYGLMSQPVRGDIERGAKAACEELGLVVDYREISSEVDKDASLAIPVISGYLSANPDVKGIIAVHGNVTAVVPEALKAAGKGPDDIMVAGFDLSKKSVLGLQEGYLDVIGDQQLFLQGYLPIVQIVLTKLYGFTGLHVPTGAGYASAKNINQLIPLIDKGIR